MATFDLITGRRGSGKSFKGCKLCYTAALENARVHTNLDLVRDKWQDLGLWKNIVLLSEDVSEWRNQIIGGEEGRENLIVLDESMFQFHVHDQQGNRSKNREIFELLVWGRKLGLDCYFIAHKAENIDIQLRRMADNRWVCKAAGRIQVIGWFIAQAHKVPLIGRLFKGWSGDFLFQKWDADQKYHYFTETCNIEAPIKDLYRTDSTMGRMLDVKREVTRTTATVDEGAKRGRFRIFATFSVLVLGLCWWGKSCSDVFSGKTTGSMAQSAKTQAHQGHGFAQSSDIDGERWVAAVEGRQLAPDLTLWLSDGTRVALGSYVSGSQVRSIHFDGNRWHVGTATADYEIAQHNTHKEKWQNSKSSPSGSSARFSPVR